MRLKLRWFRGFLSESYVGEARIAIALYATALLTVALSAFGAPWWLVGIALLLGIMAIGEQAANAVRESNEAAVAAARAEWEPELEDARAEGARAERRQEWNEQLNRRREGAA